MGTESYVVVGASLLLSLVYLLVRFHPLGTLQLHSPASEKSPSTEHSHVPWPLNETFCGPITGEGILARLEKETFQQKAEKGRQL